jgi:two-component system phosphate regulon response regulator PhoB
MPRVLVIDSDAPLRTAVAKALVAEGHDVETAESGQAGLAMARTFPPDVVVFDFLSSVREDLDLCRSLRADPSAAGAKLLVLSSESDEPRRVAAFEAGVDDYLAKPCSMRELVLRVRALARRTSVRPPSEVLSVGTLRIDRAARRADIAGVEVDLTRREFDVLLFLADRAGRVQTRDALVGNVWGELTDSGRVVDTTIKRLRRKLGDAGPAISTVRGVGYKLE